MRPFVPTKTFEILYLLLIDIATRNVAPCILLTIIICIIKIAFRLIIWK